MPPAYNALAHYALSELFLCLDCERVGNSRVNCPACFSTHVFPLTTWIVDLMERDAVEVLP
jgi:hypothetical protein